MAACTELVERFDELVSFDTEAGNGEGGCRVGVGEFFGERVAEVVEAASLELVRGFETGECDHLLRVRSARPNTARYVLV